MKKKVTKRKATKRKSKMTSLKPGSFKYIRFNEPQTKVDFKRLYIPLGLTVLALVLLAFLSGCSPKDGSVGPMGPTGEVGAVGAQGEAGPSCSVVQLPDGAVINCPDGSSAVVSNGKNGKNCTLKDLFKWLK